MNLQLKDKIVLITGSSSGLGKATAIKFLEEGAKVIITGRDGNKLKNSGEELSSKYGEKNIFSFQGDLTDLETIDNCVREGVEYFGRIDILIANIGTGRGKSGWDVSEYDWEKMFELNFNGVRRIINVLVPEMIKNKGGAIVFISSIAGVEVIGAPIHYSVAKSALISYSKNLSKLLAKENIRVNTISPGNIYFEGGTWDLKLKENKEKVLAMLEKSVPLKRFAIPEEIASLIIFMSSPRASFVTGSTLIADGGQTVRI